jgi:hypothetical protein
MNRSNNTEMPNLFIIGAAKCGTTSLHHYLDQHPEISMSSVKEPLFFLPEGFRAAWDLSPVAMTRDEYLSLFRPGTRFRGEASTDYTRYPLHPEVPSGIRSAAPDARLIYLVRDPIERIRANWVQRMGTRLASNRGPSGLLSLSEQIGDFDDPDNPYTWQGMYMTQIRRYLEHFPRESLLIIDSDELMTERESALSEIFGFLGLDQDFTHPSFTEERNGLATKKVESSAYIRMTRSGPLRRIVDLLPGGIRESAIEAVRRPMLVPAEKPEVDPELRTELEELFRPEVEELRQFTGRSFSSWSV